MTTFRVETVSSKFQRRPLQTFCAGVASESLRISRLARVSTAPIFRGAIRPVLPLISVKVHRLKVRGVVPRRGLGNLKLRHGIILGGNLEWNETPRESRITRENVFCCDTSVAANFVAEYAVAFRLRRLCGCAKGTATLLGRHQRLCADCTL
jgi:hypothetical protein